MARWKIVFSRQNNTEVLIIEAARTPSVEQACRALLAHAQAHFEREGPGPDADMERTPAVRLAEHYGVTLTGISRSD